MAKIIERRDFNTNNAWGFGGALGTRTTYDNGYASEHGHACFRHLKAEPFSRFFDPAGKRITEEEFLAAIREV